MKIRELLNKLEEWTSEAGGRYRIDLSTGCVLIDTVSEHGTCVLEQTGEQQWIFRGDSTAVANLRSALG